MSPAPPGGWSWPAPLLPPGVTRRTIHANGLEFELAEAGTGDRLALCLHGFPELNLSWRHQMPLLAELGWRVWAPNQRGYGATSRPPNIADYAMEHLLADIAALIDASGAREVMLVAHDWGGAVAWEFARRRIRPLSRLAVMNMPHPQLLLRELRRNPRQMLRSWYIGLFQIPRLPEARLTRHGAAALTDVFRTGPGRPPIPHAVIDAYRAAILRPGAATAMLNWYRAAVRHGGARLPPAEPIATPTLLLWGDADIALDIATTRGTAALAPDLTFRRLPGISHWVQQDAPEEVNAALRDWLPPTA